MRVFQKTISLKDVSGTDFMERKGSTDMTSCVTKKKALDGEHVNRTRKDHKPIDKCPEIYYHTYEQLNIY